MEYAAKHYVKITGQKFMPGEIIDVAIPEDKLPRLLKLGAIVPLDTPMPHTASTEDDATPNDAEDASEDAAMDDDAEDAVDEEAEAPEIDVMDGIVAKDEAPAKATTKKTAKSNRSKEK